MPARKNQHKSKKKHHQQSQQQQQQVIVNNEPTATNETTKTTTTIETASATATATATGKATPTTSQKIVSANATYRIEQSSVYGRYLVANRDLAPAELLITELPLAIGPCVSAEPVCLGCYMPVELRLSQFRCPECAWPMCAADCHGAGHQQGHGARECAFLKERRAQAADLLTPRATTVEVKNLYELVLIVRILLLKECEPERYAQVLLMEAHTEQRRKNPTLWQHYQVNVVERLRNAWQLAALHSEADIHNVCGILDVNCFEIGQNTAKARTLYPSAFLLAHDCSPNTAHTDDPQTYAIYLRTSQRVRRGSPLTLSYAYTLQGTLKRRDFIHAGKLFWCQCRRCADPRELTTDCSGIVCAQCAHGTVRATQPLEQDAPWACDACAYNLSAPEVVRLLDKINNDLETIDAHDIPGLENFLKRYRNVLTPNHYLLLSAKYSLCQIYGRIEGYLLQSMSLEDIKRKERYCRDFLAVVDVLEPGLTRLRGLIMYELHAPIMVIAQRLLQSNLISRQDFQRSLKEVVRLLRHSRDILKLEPAGSSEHTMGLAAAEALTKMGCGD